MKLTKYPAGLALAVTLFFVSAAAAQQAAPAADLDYQTGAVLYMQKAAEYRALCYQAFNIARLRLDTDLDKKNVKKLPKAERKMPRAIIVDIDETVLDNSPAQARGIRTNTPYNSKDWYEWSNKGKAKAIPGVVEFLNYAVSKGVKIFYISNRDDKNEKQITIENLKCVEKRDSKCYGLNDVSAENVMLKTSESGKEARRSIVTAKYRVVMLVGDNLDDFTSAFEKKSVADRFGETDKAKDFWGSKFIVLPNAMYGTWENAIYEYQRLTEAQKAEKRAAALELP
ncbi:MAG: 5'-nucleotidase, lipoprotein e(P4) family [Acidobacteria bacterium]|nr:MAG: 5'-nucleotidase, lipoprotein e(P4) family [Acidobacteriota bacterium]